MFISLFIQIVKVNVKIMEWITFLIVKHRLLWMAIKIVYRILKVKVKIKERITFLVIFTDRVVVP